MSDRFNALTVVLAYDVSEETAESLKQAICQMRGILRVHGNVADLTAHIAETRARDELASKLWDVLYPKEKV